MTLYNRLVMFKPTKVCKVISVNCLTLFARVYAIMLLSAGYFQVLLVSAHSALSIPAGPLCTIEAIMIYISIHHWDNKCEKSDCDNLLYLCVAKCYSETDEKVQHVFNTQNNRGQQGHF